MKKIIMIILVLFLIGCSNNNPLPSLDVTECIASKSTLYVTAGCSSCQKQENMFGDDFEKLNSVDCAVDGARCAEADIIRLPTWVIDGMNHAGVKDIEELKTLTGC